MKVPFTYYLHGEKLEAWHFFQLLSMTKKLDLDKEALDKLQWSFYEIALQCELDTETLEVSIVGVE